MSANAIGILRAFASRPGTGPAMPGVRAYLGPLAYDRAALLEAQAAIKPLSRPMRPDQITIEDMREVCQIALRACLSEEAR